MKLLQMGMGWFPQQAGGLNRFFYDFQQSLALDQSVSRLGLITGMPQFEGDLQQCMFSFAQDNDALVSRLFLARKAFKKLNQAFMPDLITGHFALYTFPIIDLLRRLPLVVHFQGPWAFESQIEGQSAALTKIKQLIESKVYQRADKLIAMTDAFKNFLVKNYYVDESNVEVIPGAVDTQRFSLNLNPHEARLRLNWPVDRPIVLVVRRLVKRMGLENMINAFVSVKQSVPDALLLIAGQGHYRPFLDQLIKEKNLENHVKLLGYLHDDSLPYAYRAADLTLVPTTALEGFGLTAVESLASGTPTLVTPIGGLPEVVNGLSSAMILPDNSEAQLARYTSDALLNKITLPSADLCQRYAQQNFDWSVIAPQIIDLYRRVINCH
jgi:glycosyltransferase involved in cell wall biosynthesis